MGALTNFSRWLVVILLLPLGFIRQPISLAEAVSIDPWLVEQQALAGEHGGEVEFLVVLRDQADLSGAAGLSTKEDKGRFVFEQLTRAARRSQPAVVQRLTALGAETRSYWIANMVWVRGDWSLVDAAAALPGVAAVRANPRVQIDLPEPESSLLAPQALAAVEANLFHIQADKVWDAGFTGQGVVIGGQDTGYDWDHPALINSYRGWEVGTAGGGTADHSYSWHDAIHTPGSNCGADSAEPCDDNGHGTHTMGIMVGDDGGANKIGVAPGAEWIGCRNMDRGVGTPATYAECFEWFLAPYPMGSDPMSGDPSLAPDIVNNSWSCPPSEGCNDPNVLLPAVTSLRAAGILVVVSAGNSGPECSSIGNPAGIYDEVFTVGSTGKEDDEISGFSSRGPVTVDASSRMKPDITAPGESIRSSVPGGGYLQLSGTSMAAPHTAGAVALILSANPLLRGQPAQVEDILRGSAVQITAEQDCGGVSGKEIPNNTYGWGRVDAFNGYVKSLLTNRVFMSIVYR